MANERTYTYRNGEKLALTKKPDEYVVRMLPDKVFALGLGAGEQVSSASTRVRVPAAKLNKEMERARESGIAHHGYTDAQTGQELLITDRVMVRFKNKASAEDISAIQGRYGLTPLARYTPLDYLFELTAHTGMNPVKLVVAMKEKEEFVESAENDLNYRMGKRAPAPPSDGSYAAQWHLHATPGSDVDPRAHARCEEAWTRLDSYGLDSIVVGLSDDGCRLDHPDFDSPGKFAGWGYFSGTRLVANLDPDAEPAKMYDAGNSHGTSCAGVIAGEVDGGLIVGAAPGCRLLPVKWENLPGGFLGVSDSKLMTMLAFVSDKVDILSNSWGVSPASLWSQQVIERVGKLAQSGGRRGKGILFLWAAGNENCPISYTTSIDTPFTDGWEFSAGQWSWAGPQTSRVFRHNLVNIPGVLHVAALASTAQRSHYSNYGPGIDICAPSSNSHAYWRMEVAGRAIVTASGEADQVTTEFGGTSSATPLVAGIAALVLSANPSLSALRVASILRATASKDLDFTGYSRSPATAFDPNPKRWDVSPIAPFDKGDFLHVPDKETSWSPWFGCGRVDADQAVAMAGAVTMTQLPLRRPPLLPKRSGGYPAPLPSPMLRGSDSGIGVRRLAFTAGQKVKASSTDDTANAIWSVSFDCVAAMWSVGGWVDPLRRIDEYTSDPSYAAAIADYINQTVPAACTLYGLIWNGITASEVAQCETVEALRLRIAGQISAATVVASALRGVRHG